MRTTWWAALTGVVSAFVLLATAELIALFISASASPLFAVGQLAIDLAPLWLKEAMIALFGTGDKAALLVILGVVIVVGSGVAGWLEFRWPPVGSILLGVAAVVAVIAVVTRTGASPLAAVPTVLGAIVGIVVLRLGIDRLHRWQDTAARAETSSRVLRPSDTVGPARRQFLVLLLGTGGAALVVGAGARFMNAASSVVTAARGAIALPDPTIPAPPVPAGADLGIDGLSPYVTPNADFYRIDIALQPPQVDPGTWSLKIHGMVDKEVTLSYDDLLALPMVEHMTTIACVSNEVGGNLIGNASWLGYPLRDLLAMAGPQTGADMVLSSGPDGFTAGTPVGAMTDPAREAIIAVGMNGEPLPVEHGFPARLIVPGLYGYVSATKWVTELKLTRFADEEGYWTPRGWSEKGPIKTESRIDTPRDGATVDSGTVAIAGVAWAQHTGIEKVEVRVDSGSWQTATLAADVSDDTWVQWTLPWSADSGNHSIAVRATDASGYTQTDQEAPPAPNGASGWHTISVGVG